MELDLYGGDEKYLRRRASQRGSIAILAFVAITAPLLLGLGRTDTLICRLAAVAVHLGLNPLLIESRDLRQHPNGATEILGVLANNRNRERTAVQHHRAPVAIEHDAARRA